jgi:hypothetical protein
MVAFRLDSGHDLPLQGFTITLRHIKFGRTPLDERSARRRDLYLTTHNTHKKQTSMSSERFEPTVPESKRSQTHALDRAATEPGKLYFGFRKFQHQVTGDFTRSTTDIEDKMCVFYIKPPSTLFLKLFQNFGYGFFLIMYETTQN